MTILSFPTTIDGAHTHRFTGILDQQLIAYCELALTNEQAHVATLYSLYVDPPTAPGATPASWFQPQ